METLKGLDEGLFHILNGSTANPVFDVVMPFVTELDNFLAVIVIAVAGLLIFGGSKGRWLVVLLVLALVLGDFTAMLIKKTFARVRPCHALEGARVLTGCGGAFSFPSAHATNITASMTLLSTRYGKLAPAFVFLALLVSYSRVYVGVHYPFDVAAGMVLGVAVALAVHGADRRLAGYFRERSAGSARGQRVND